MRDSIDSEARGNITGYIVYDTDPFDPRGDDNLATLACWHRNYQLGDEQPKAEPIDYMIGLLEEVEPRAYATLTAARERGRKVSTLLDHYLARHYVVLPLYLYEHGGISISVGGFSCPWDSGQVGIAHIRLSAVEAENLYGEGAANLAERGARWIKGEVEDYDRYLTGQVYGFIIEADGETRDSCYGFYDRDDCRSEMLSALDYWHGEAMKHSVIDPLGMAPLIARDGASYL